MLFLFFPPFDLTLDVRLAAFSSKFPFQWGFSVKNTVHSTPTFMPCKLFSVVFLSPECRLNGANSMIAFVCVSVSGVQWMNERVSRCVVLWCDAKWLKRKTTEWHKKLRLDQDENNIIYFLQFIPILYHSLRSVRSMSLPLPTVTEHVSKCSCYLIACGSFSAIGITRIGFYYTPLSLSFRSHSIWMVRKIVFIYAPLPFSLSLCVCVYVLCLLARFDLQCAHTAEWLTPFRFNTASGQWNGILAISHAPAHILCIHCTRHFADILIAEWKFI